MKKNMYYQRTLARENVLSGMILRYFLQSASYPRLLLEVFIRKDFGHRYFRLSSSVTVIFFLGICPFLWDKLKVFLAKAQTPMFGIAESHKMTGYTTWYIFLAAFLAFSIRHKIDKNKRADGFDFSRYSKNSGKINPLFYKIKLQGTAPDIRLVETLLEPAPFFIAGILLWLLGENLGILLIITSIYYALGYVAAYRVGDNFILDKIDEMIVNEELEKAFVGDVDEEETRGFRFMGHKPKTEDMRRKILPLLTGDDETVEAK